MDARTIAVDAVVVLTGCNRDTIAALIEQLYRAGVTDPKRLTFKGSAGRRPKLTGSQLSAVREPGGRRLPVNRVGDDCFSLFRRFLRTF